MEIKRAAELCICSLLREQISDIAFYPAKGGGDDVTPVWKVSHNYFIGDVLRATDLTKVQAIVVEENGNSGSTEPSFDDVIGSTFSGPPDYQTAAAKAVSMAIDAGNPMPPFATVMIEPGEKTMAQEETDYLHGTLVYVTRADATNTVSHSADFKRIYDALATVGNGYDILRRLIVHGVDITSTYEFTDEARQAHGDAISFVMGVTEKPAQG